MFTGVKDFMLDDIRWTLSCLNRIDALDDVAKTFAALHRNKPLDIFEDKQFGPLNVDVLVHVMEYIASAFVVFESLLFAGGTERLAWESCDVKIDGRHGINVSMYNILIKNVRWKI